MTTLTIVQARNGLSDALNRVSYRGERIRISRHGKAVAALISADDLALLERAEEAIDLRDAGKALREYERNPSIAVPLAEYVKTRQARA